MGKKPKTAVMSDDERTMIESKMWAKARAEHQEEIRPQREREEYEHFKREVRTDDSAKISAVIFQALSRGNIRADIALREYIAELIDAGRDDELNLQLRFYLVQYLVHPLVRPLQTYARE